MEKFGEELGNYLSEIPLHEEEERGGVILYADFHASITGLSQDK